MALITLHPESRIEIRPAVVNDDDEVIGMGTSIEVSLKEFIDVVIANIPDDGGEGGG